MAITKLNSLAIPAITIDSNERVGLGTTSPTDKLHVSVGSSGGASAHSYTDLLLESNSHTAVQISGPNTAEQAIWFADPQASTAGGIMYYHPNNTLTLRTAETNRMVVDGSGDVTVSTGNLVIGTNGKGIDFSAGSNASGMTSELLDDYEEGTCTLSLTSSGTFPTVSYTNQTAYYVKVGKVVTLSWYSAGLNISNAGSGTAKIAGLPYSASTAGHHYPVVNVTHNTATIHTVDSGYAYASEMHLMQSGLTTNLAEWTSGNPKYIMVTITYMTT